MGNRFFKTEFGKSLKAYNVLYLLLFGAIGYLVLFKVVPAFNQIYYCFFSFSPFAGDTFNGLGFFREVFANPDFWRAFRNNIILNSYLIVFYFPIPIIISLMINEMSNKLIKKFFQSAIVIPNFISWVVVGGLFVYLLSPERGPINNFLQSAGLGSVNFMTNSKWFRSVLITSYDWKFAGYGTLIYLAAICGIDAQLYEAAEMDGAKRFGKIWHITLPCIRDTIFIVLLLQISTTFSSFTDQVLIMYNPLVYNVSDVLGTYSYREGLVKFNFSQSTVVTTVGALLSFTVFEVCSYVSKKTTGRSIL